MHTSNNKYTTLLCFLMVIFAFYTTNAQNTPRSVFVKYINENAYCQVVLTGESFCSAAINGFLLILKHSATFMFTRGIGGIFNLLGKLTISVLNSIIAYLLIIYVK